MWPQWTRKDQRIAELETENRILRTLLAQKGFSLAVSPLASSPKRTPDRIRTEADVIRVDRGPKPLVPPAHVLHPSPVTGPVSPGKAVTGGFSVMTGNSGGTVDVPSTSTPSPTGPSEGTPT